jgi:hypothetical protein
LLKKIKDLSAGSIETCPSLASPLDGRDGGGLTHATMTKGQSQQDFLKMQPLCRRPAARRSKFGIKFDRTVDVVVNLG